MSDVQIVVTIQGVISINTYDLPASIYSAAIYDDTTLYVQPCPVLTFSDDNSGVCRCVCFRGVVAMVSHFIVAGGAHGAKAQTCIRSTRA